MGKSSPAAPPPPDYVGAANATAAANMEMAKYATEANRINQNNPYGSLSYSQDGNGRWTQTETLDPRIQEALNSQIKVQTDRSQYASDLLGEVKSSYATPFNPNRLESYLSGVNNVNQDSLGRAGNFNSNASINTGTPTANELNTQFGQFNGGPQQNLNAPSYDPSRAQEYANKAFESQMALLSPEMERYDTSLRNSLALQGLTPGTEASTNALTSYELGRAGQMNSLAASSYLTGNEAANRDYSSQLNAYNSQNNAANTQFGNNLQQFGANTEAQRMGNDANTQNFTNQLQSYLQGNQAQLQQFGMDQASYDNQLRGLSANAGLQQAENDSQSQAYSQALSEYGTNWQQDQTLRNLPLNELNALMSGQQVQNPEFKNYYLQNQTAGADYLGAASSQGDWDRGIYNAQAAEASSGNAALGNLASAAMMMFAMSDERLKKNIEKVGETPGGTNVYQWDWNTKGKKIAGNQPTVGVIAQENPHAAKKTSTGYLGVDYSKIK